MRSAQAGNPRGDVRFTGNETTNASAVAIQSNKNLSED
jgi:hypothetical protein